MPLSILHPTGSMDQNPKTKLLIQENQKPKEKQEQKIPWMPIIKGLKKTVSTMHLDTVEELSLRILTLQCIHCWIKNLIPAVDPTHTQPKIPMMMMMMIAQLMSLSNSLTTQNSETSADDTELTFCEHFQPAMPSTCSPTNAV